MRVRPENAALPLVIFVTFCPKNSAQAPTTQDVCTEGNGRDGEQRTGRGFGDGGEAESQRVGLALGHVVEAEGGPEGNIVEVDGPGTPRRPRYGPWIESFHSNTFPPWS